MRFSPRKPGFVTLGRFSLLCGCKIMLFSIFPCCVTRSVVGADETAFSTETNRGGTLFSRLGDRWTRRMIGRPAFGATLTRRVPCPLQESRAAARNCRGFPMRSLERQGHSDCRGGEGGGRCRRAGRVFSADSGSGCRRRRRPTNFLGGKDWKAVLTGNAVLCF